jgi:hypothetical protein
MGEAIIGVIGTAVGAFIGLGTAWLTVLHGERAQVRAEQRQLRAQRLELLAELLLLLRRTLPFRLDGNPDRTRNLDEIFGEFRGEYAPIQRMLATLAVSDPDPALRALAGNLAAAVGQSLSHTYLLARAVQRLPGPGHLHELNELSAGEDVEAIARDSYDHALALHEQVAAAIRGR